MGNQTAKTAFPIPQSSEKYWEIKNQTETSAELYLYSTISSWGEEWGDTSAKDVINAVKNLGNISQLKIYINSPGGTVSEGMAIKAFLARQTFKKDVYIDGLCASIATAIAFGINATVHMESTALVMIHNAWTGVYGNAVELRKVANDSSVLNENPEIHIDITAAQAIIDKANAALQEYSYRKEKNIYGN